ncbi:MAG: deoxyribose-phosphate aldolase [Phycisphaerales bacterium]|nr:deoxyribose-phosphate aldolase [Phycisphaerales bacterium]
MPPTVDKVMTEQRAASFTKRSIKTAAKASGLRLALSMLDLTTLEGKDSEEKVRSLCRKAIAPDPAEPSLPHVAAVCVYPTMVGAAARALRGSGVKVASVATGFPSAQYPLPVRLDDTRRAIDDGADEIDMVISRGLFLAGRRSEVYDEIAATKEVCVRTDPSRRISLKVILETGELETYDLVRAASDLALAAGLAEGDFIKTSTGKVQPAATMPVTLIMLEAVRDHFLRTGVRIGVKPAGGIRTSKNALHYLVMVKETLGDDWLHPDLFRFGASTLTNDILMQIARLRTGCYMAAHDFSEA